MSTDSQHLTGPNTGSVSSKIDRPAILKISGVVGQDERVLQHGRHGMGRGR